MFLLAGFLVMEMVRLLLPRHVLPPPLTSPPPPSPLTVQDFSPEDALKPFRTTSPAPLPYRDASYGVCTYALTLADCMSGLKRAKDLNLINFATFDVQLYGPSPSCIDNM